MMMIVADYDQIELRKVAMLSGDPEFCETFRQGNDPHTDTAKLIFGPGCVDHPDFTDEFRFPSKTANFLRLFGGGANKLRIALNGKKSLDECESFLAKWDQSYAGVTAFLNGVRRRTINEEPHESRTIIGRRRLYDPYYADQGEMERQSGNHVIQGSAGDILKSALVEMYRAGLDIRLPVHDETLTYCKPEDSEHHRYLVEKCMTRGAEKIVEIGMKKGIYPKMDPTVPITTAAKIAMSWAEGKE